MQKYMLFLVMLMLAMPMFAGEAKAGPLFCLNASGMKSQCIFYSAEACRTKAQNITRAWCTINPQEMKTLKGPGQWCLVTSTHYVQCYYDNFASCQKQTKSKNGICVRSNKRSPLSKEFESDVEQLF